jgi:hypothetical protein
MGAAKAVAENAKIDASAVNTGVWASCLIGLSYG